MRKKLFTYHSPLVPVLACIAALLFSANFYQFLQKNLKKWWGWDFDCPTEEVCQRHQTIHVKPHDRHIIIFEYDDGHEIDFEVDRVDRDLKRAEQALRRNLERALRDMQRLHERMEWDGTVEVRVKRLNEEIQTKTRNLERFEKAIQRMQFEIEQAETDHRRKHRRKSIRIRVHR